MMNFLKTGLAVGITLVGLSALNANATLSYDVETGSNEPIVLKQDQKVLLHVPKQSYETYNISFQGDGVNFDVPLHSQDTYFFDATQAPTRRVTYTVKTMDGQTVSSGDIVNNYVYTAQTDISSVLRQRTSYDYSQYQKPEPRYYNRSNVRGYW